MVIYDPEKEKLVQFQSNEDFGVDEIYTMIKDNLAKEKEYYSNHNYDIVFGEKISKVN
jgi:hypothetical protein